MKILILTIFAIFAICETTVHIKRIPYKSGFMLSQENRIDLSYEEIVTEGPEESMESTNNTRDIYFYVENYKQLNWYDAQTECVKMGAQLASIESAEEDQIVQKFLKTLDGPSYPWRFWLSAHDLETQGDFKWNSSGKSLNYTNWGTWQPDNYFNEEHCVVIWRECNTTWRRDGVIWPHNCWDCRFPFCDWDNCWNMRWNDVPCSVESNYICESSSPITFE